MLKALKVIFFSIIVLIVAALSATALYVFVLIQQVPRIDSITHYRPNLTSHVYDAHGEVIGEFFIENREIVPLEAIPPLMISAMIASEDKAFFEHKGLNLQGIMRAMIANIKAGRVVQGGSTITQQLTKSLLLTPERKLSRKIKEGYLAYKIENQFTKDEILMLYLNQIYFGSGAYGIKRAAWNYFRKTPVELTLAEMSLLAGLPQAPSRYSPLNNPRGAKLRQRYVLNQMAQSGFILEDEEAAAAAEVIRVYRQPESREHTRHFLEFIRRELIDIMPANSLFTDGWEIQTTINAKLQDVAQNALINGLREIDKRRGWRGPLSKTPPEEFDVARTHLRKKNFESKVLYFEISVEDELVPKYATDPDRRQIGDVYECLVVSVDDNKEQAVITNGVTEGVIHLETSVWARRINPRVSSFREPLRKLSDALAPGDIILARLSNLKPETYELEQVPLVEGALLSVHIPTGRIISMSGGRDFGVSQFNRAYQAARQPGSGFKPVIYAKALEVGLAPNTIIVDAPLIYETEVEKEVFEGIEGDFEPESVDADAGPGPVEPEKHVWKPANYGETFYGDVTLREAIVLSRNVPTIKLVQSVGVRPVIDFSRRLGLENEFPRDLSISLGSTSHSLWNMMLPYAIFANTGLSVDFYAVQDVRHVTTGFTVFDQPAPVLPSSMIEARDVISPQLAYLITRLMMDVVTSGTARGIDRLGGPFAGKTGTTNDYMDAWFIGYTPDVVTGVWVGFDAPEYIGIGETGSRAAAPIWLEFMKAAVEKYPITEFDVPPGIEFAWMDPNTGRIDDEDAMADAVQIAYYADHIPRRPKVIGGFDRIEAVTGRDKWTRDAADAVDAVDKDDVADDADEADEDEAQMKEWGPDAVVKEADDRPDVLKADELADELDELDIDPEVTEQAIFDQYE